MSHIEATEKGLSGMQKGDPDEPLYMLNLLKFRDEAQPGAGVDGLSGQDAYNVYGKKFSELNPRFGGTAIWMGKAWHTVIGPEDWDIVILVRYPSRKLFLEMIEDPSYQAISPIRSAALGDSRLVEMSQLLSNPI